MLILTFKLSSVVFKLEFIGTIKDSITVMNSEGEEEPYFCPKFLVQKYLKMSDADLELNEKYKLEEKLDKQKDDKEGEDEEGGDEEESGGEDEGGNEGGSEGDDMDIDDEMLGDVTPESSETSQL